MFSPVPGTTRKKHLNPGRYAILAVSVLLLSLLLAACSEESKPATSTEISNLPRLSLANCAASAGQSLSSTPVVNKTVPVPTGFRIWVSNIYPYALSYPDNWDVRENQTAGNLKSDLIVAEYKDTTRAFVYVLSEKLDNPATDSKAYYDSKVKELTATQKGLSFDQQGEHDIAGVPAYVISFNASQPSPIQSLQLTFATQGRGWVISYSASPDVSQKYCGQFSRMLDTFTLTNLQK